MSESVSSYLSAVKWSDEAHYLGEFARHFELPQVARIIKGQYRQLGVSSLPSLNQVILLTAAGPRVKVAAQCVKFKEGRRAVTGGTKLAIPENYDGWFEILSEEGRSARCIEGVAELARRGPAICLLREPIKCFVGRPEDPETPSDKTRLLPSGETLTLAGEVTGSVKGPKRCLKCYSSKGEALFLGMGQRCRFSAVAGEENISGVHTIRTLLRKRFPMMVRLVHGRPPPGVKSFVPEMRLHALYQEERTLVALPLLKDSQRAVALPPGLPLKLQVPRNADALLKLREHSRLREWSQRLAQEAADRIQVLEPIKRKQQISVPPQSPPALSNQQQPGCTTRSGVLTQRSLSDPCEPFDDRRYEEIDQIYDYVRGFAPLPERIKSDFVPPQTPTATHNGGETTPNVATAQQQDSTDTVVPTATVEARKDESEDKVEVADEEKMETNKPPEPPPIETIPARRASTGDTTPTRKVLHLYEKVNTRLPVRSNSAGKVLSTTPMSPSKLFQKSSVSQHYQQRPRLFKHSKSSPALKEQPPSKKPPSSSPLFHIRYKSLTNLLDFNNTLDSSHSGQTSSGSAGSAAKRSKLPRPKSLSNLLMWEDTRNKYNLLQSKFIFPPSTNNNKRLGTLYL